MEGCHGCRGVFLRDAVEDHGGNLRRENFAAPQAQPRQPAHGLSDLQHAEAGIGEHYVRGAYESLYELCPDDLLTELNGQADQAQITALMKRYRAQKR
ncbi:hypothetical protein GCM10011578_060350 [Streptomyces fuscichromogenes]|uniref:Uncharacterized protein n=1 Tax=Streptomyces fuscichromogenes TaxID=1324013 RepID=A0A917XHE4_9ACTN|nr:hypothetical protein GCM10011578_060350 [Streptomyces fuscichromogenes]